MDGEADQVPGNGRQADQAGGKAASTVRSMASGTCGNWDCDPPDRWNCPPIVAPIKGYLAAGFSHR